MSEMAEDKLWCALRQHPKTTTADLASLAGIGKSTAGKILTRWTGVGTAVRVSSPATDGIRRADLWSISDVPEVGAQDEPDSGKEEAATSRQDSAVAEEEVAAEELSPASEPEEPVTRLPSGGLRGLVEDYLRDNPGGVFGPDHIGKALDRSAGAVNNALETLTKLGTAVKASDKRAQLKTVTDITHWSGRIATPFGRFGQRKP